jgi:hypothetical protein
MKMRLAGVIAVLALAAAGLGAIASGAERPPPQVICISNSSGVQIPEGFYAARPHSCNLHARNQPAVAFAMVMMRKLHWVSWGQERAVGTGRQLVNMVGPVPATVQLSVPQNVCGHRIFTVAKFKSKSGKFGDPMPLDRHLAGEC